MFGCRQNRSHRRWNNVIPNTGCVLIYTSFLSVFPSSLPKLLFHFLPCHFLRRRILWARETTLFGWPYYRTNAKLDLFTSCHFFRGRIPWAQDINLLIPFLFYDTQSRNTKPKTEKKNQNEKSWTKPSYFGFKLDGILSKSKTETK